MVAPLTVYFAGELFDHKDLIGNALLASSIEKHSEGRFRVVLPQDSKSAGNRAEEIRDHNLKRLIQCDLALFNFDGLELDSGTVVEFVFAKFLDMPSVILRSDLRRAGDQDSGGDDWNLMCSFFPRTKVVRSNAMAVYQEIRANSESLGEAIDRFCGGTASQVIDALDSVRGTPPLAESDQELLNSLYRWVLRASGGGLAELCSDPSFVEDLLRSKKKKGLV
jgi:nucleoside 2-deoxyribosyltransferase